MDTFIGFAAIVITTILALFAALGLQALLLRLTFALMQPATAARRIAPSQIENGARLAARAYAKAH
jgi:hypothetical protein